MSKLFVFKLSYGIASLVICVCVLANMAISYELIIVFCCHMVYPV